MKSNIKLPGNNSNIGITRRQAIGGLAAAIVLPTVLKPASATTATITTTPLSPVGEFPETMPLPRYGHTTVVVESGIVIVAGGQNDGGILSDVQYYYEGNWYELPPMNIPRTNHAAAVVEDTVFVFGGQNDGGPLAEVEVYGVGGPFWEIIDPMEMPRYGHTATWLIESPTVLIAGGFYNGPISSYEFYGLI
jgi:hypothetical protein